MIAELPVNEILRLKALHDLAVLDTPREQSFDDVAQVAMQLCNTPMAVVSLIDKNRQWFKSCIGMDAMETSRDIAFCAHAILTPQDILIVPDATLDNRFADNPMVTNAPYIHFYAGAPLVTEDGLALGTLCVVDYEPRILSQAQINSLGALARQVMQLLKLKSINNAVQEYSSRMQLIADNVPVLIGELNLAGRYIFCNKKYEDWLHHDVKTCIGKSPVDIYPAKTHDVIARGIAKGCSGESHRIEIILENDRALDISYMPKIENGNVVGIFEVATDATERRFHLQIMEQERERLTAIIDGTNIGTWEWDIATNKLYINERWATMLGYSLAELQPVTIDTWRHLLHPDDAEHTHTLLAQHLSGELSFYDCQFRLRKKNGEWHWVHAHGKTVSRNADGQSAVLSGMHMDIHDIRNTYNRLKESEDLLRSLLSNLPGAAYRRENNSSWTIHYLSDAVEQLTGYPVKNFINNSQLSFNDITHPQDIERVYGVVQAAIEARESFDIEYRIQRADGEWRNVQEIGRGVFDGACKLQYIDGFIWDIQARIDSVYEKWVMTNKLSQLFEMAPIGIMQVKENGQVLDANPEFIRMIGFNKSELNNLSILDFTQEDDWEKSVTAMSDVQNSGRFGPFEKNYRHKNGELVQVEVSGYLINMLDSEGQCWWTLVKDIREQKRIERMKSEFISTVSHELRTPLTSISGALSLIANNMLGAVPDKAKPMLEIAHKNSQRLSLLINDLLDMEKLIAGKMSFDMSVKQVSPLVQQALVENKIYADKYHVKFLLNDFSALASINIDGFRLQQVLNNFLSNAAKYSPAQHHVDISITLSQGWVRIAVRDYGQGIPEEFKTRMFQKFSQADSSDSRQKSGTGLGLAISKELVERMGGRIGFESESNKGSCFFAEFKQV
jgi:PAS domain S-box-containing protein